MAGHFPHIFEVRFGNLNFQERTLVIRAGSCAANG